jgi:hypothetical protein
MDTAGSAVHGERLTNEVVEPSTLFSNALRNLASQLQTPFHGVNAAVERATVEAHSLLSVDAADPRTTLGKRRSFGLPETRFHESLAGNAPQAVLLLLATAYALWRWPGSARWFIVCLGIAFLAFSALFKWQGVGSNLFLPIVLAGCAVSGAVIADRVPNRAAAVGLLLVACYCAPYALFNSRRPLLGERSVLRLPRLTGYFAGHSERAERLHRVVDELYESGCRQIGLVVDNSSPEYSAWAFFRAKGARFELRHVEVENATRMLTATESFDTCATLRLVGPGNIVEGELRARPIPPQTQGSPRSSEWTP